MKARLLPSISALLVASFAPLANATLIDRGGGLIYDDALNITWMQDAGYFNTSGYTSANSLDWYSAMTFASGVAYYDSARNTTWTDWRLPYTINDISSRGFPASGVSSELAYMYYVNLGCSANTSMNPSDPSPTCTNANPFQNLTPRAYWSGTAFDDTRAWALHFHFGYQEFGSMADRSWVWLVRDGDVGAPQSSSVPEPASLALFGVGMLLLGVSRRNRQAA